MLSLTKHIPQRSASCFIERAGEKAEYLLEEKKNLTLLHLLLAWDFYSISFFPPLFLSLSVSHAIFIISPLSADHDFPIPQVHYHQ